MESEVITPLITATRDPEKYSGTCLPLGYVAYPLSLKFAYSEQVIALQSTIWTKAASPSEWSTQTL